MATIADLLVKISGDSTELRKELNAVKRQIKTAFGSESLNLSNQIERSFKYIGAAMLGVGVASVVMSSKMEMTKRAFEVLTGSADKAKEHLTALEQFGATTPFEFAGLTEASKKMQAYGFDVQAVIPILTVLGDAAMSVGLGQEGIDRVTLAIGQMNAKGKVSAEEMRQLAETGLPAWQLLADNIGVSVSQAMDMAKKGAISAKEGIGALLTGLDSKFGGMMDKVAGEIPQSFSNMKDSVSSIMRTLGTNITDTLDLKTKFADASKWLTGFAALAKNSGIKEAFDQMVPESIKTSIVAVAGAILGIAVPAMAMLAATTIAATYPLFLLGAAAALIAVALYRNWETVGPFFEALWTGIVNVFSWAWDVISTVVNKIMGAADWVITKVSSVINKVKSLAGIEVTDTAIIVDEKKVEKTEKKVWSLADAIKSLGGASGASGADVEKAAKAAAAALNKQQKAYDDLKEKAKAASERIEDEWIRLTKTQMDILDKWYRDEIATLNESKAVNENYQRDITRLNETYAEKRRKILHDEARERQETFKSISDGWISMQKDLTLGGLKGSSADLFSMNSGAIDEVKGIFDYFDEIGARYSSATDQQKKNILDSLNAMGIQYKLTTEDMLDFAVEKETAAAQIWKQLQDDKLDYYRQCKDIQADIDEAYNNVSIAGLQAALTAENALRMNNLEAQKSLMETWQEAYLASMSTMTQLTADMYSAAFGGISTAISDIITGASTAEEAIIGLGKSILKVIADWIAKKIAGTLLAAAVGEAALAAETAASIAAAAATAAAWAPAAAAVSLASFGANSGPAMAGISATHALSAALSIPKLADGGLATGPTLAMIGEGRNKEVVLPLSDKVFKGIAEGINGAGEKSGATINVYGDINSASDEDRIFSKLFDDTRFALMGA